MQAGTQSRREFLKTAALAAGACVAPCRLLAAPLSVPELHEAMFWESLERNAVRCSLCPKRCVVPEGKRGWCGVRENRGGRYYTLVYGRPVSIHNDPIEKKPFAHVYPGSKAFSLATVGCNFECKFCQNWSISQAEPESVSPPFVPPAEIARLARANGARTVAYTYGEPTVFYEYMHDCAVEAKALGLGNVIVSNGSMNEEPLQKLLPLMTAVKVDLKSFSPDFYQRICEGQLDPVLATLKRVKAAGAWLEIVVLVIPTLNDSAEEITAMAQWIVRELGPSVPVHFIRFHPMYKMRHLPPTPREAMQRAYDAAAAQGLNFVYATDVAGATYCPSCHAQLVERFRDVLISDSMAEAKCPKCGAEIPGVWR